MYFEITFGVVEAGKRSSSSRFDDGRESGKVAFSINPFDPVSLAEIQRSL
jgi:hypothetical protein